MTKPTERKKVLYVITKSNFGGAQRYVFDLAANLPRDHFEVAVACGGSGLLVERLATQGVRTIEVKNFRRDVSPINDVRAFFELIALYRRERPDVVHLNSAKPVTMGALAARIARVPRIVSTIHGWASNEPRPFWQRIIIRLIEWFGTALAHETIVVCQHDSRAGTTLIYNGIDSLTFLTREDARRALSIPHDAFVVGSIGELTRNKNYSTLIEAVRGRDMLAVLIGDGDERTELEHMADTNVVFKGYVPDAAQYLPAFDVFVLPSLKEGLPYVLLEAGLARLPVIATRVGGIPEIVSDDSSGILVKPGDSTALTRALEQYHEDRFLAKTHGSSLNDTVNIVFRLEDMIGGTTALY